MSNQLPDKITLRTKVRNFKATHPDFETDKLTFEKDEYGNLKRDEHGQFIKIMDVEKGIVNPRLINGKPAYNTNSTQNKRQTTSGWEGFQDWFSDNHPEQVPVGLDFKLEEGVYKFEDRAFFPINSQFKRLWDELFDMQSNTLMVAGQEVLRKIREVEPGVGQGLSDVDALKQRFDRWETRERNYLFTMEAETTFIYRGNEEFTFFGDDDLWLFIDDKLVLDMGGLHPPVSGTVDLKLSNPKNRAQDNFSTLRLRLRDDLSIQHADEYLELVLQVGQPYKMKIFYAERHTFDANCCFYTTMMFGSEATEPSSPAPAEQPQEPVIAPPMPEPQIPVGVLPEPSTVVNGDGQLWDNPAIWNVGERIVCVAPVRTIIRREEEITIVRRVRKVEEIEASPACPIGSVQMSSIQQEG